VNRPVFIVGANRSGTTLFRLILNRHSQIAVPDELSYFRGSLFRTSQRGWRNGQFTRQAYETFVRDFLTRNTEVLRPLDVEKLKVGLLVREEVDLRYPYEFVLRSWAEAHGKTRWGEKTPGNLFHAPTIVEMFPDAMFVYMVRDPRAGTSSMRNTSIFGKDIVINTLNRRHFMTVGLRLLEKHVDEQKRLVLRYEDLVTDPERSLQGVCDFLGISFEHGMLDFYVDASDFMKARASSDFNAAATRPIDSSRVDSWREQMSAREVAVVEALCRDEMRRFGYACDGRRLSAQDRLEIIVKEVYWRLQMWKNRRVPQYQVQHGLFPRFRQLVSDSKSS